MTIGEAAIDDLARRILAPAAGATESYFVTTDLLADEKEWPGGNGRNAGGVALSG